MRRLTSTRREFLQRTAVAGSGITLGRITPSLLGANLPRLLRLSQFPRGRQSRCGGYNSRWLKMILLTVLGELITGYRKLDMSILVRTDPHVTMTT